MERVRTLRLDLETFRRFSQKHRQRNASLQFLLLKHRKLRLHRLHLSLLLGEIEMGGLAGRDPKINGVQNAIDGSDVLIRDRDAHAQRQHAEISVCDICGNRQRHGLLCEARRFEHLIRRTQIVTRKAPKIEFVACSKSQPEGIAGGIGLTVIDCPLCPEGERSAWACALICGKSAAR